MKLSTRKQAIIQLVVILLIIVIINLLSQRYYAQWDLTEDKRFTLTPATEQILSGLEDNIYAKVLLSGKLPIEFQRLQQSVFNLLEEYKKRTGGTIEYIIEDPNEGSVDAVNNARQNLAKEGILPMSIRVMESDEMVEKIIYPYVLFTRGTRTIPVNILESQAISISPDEQLNNSIALLEYKYTNVIQKLTQQRIGNIAFLDGHGELTKRSTIDLENELRTWYNTGRLYLDSIYKIDPAIDLVLINKPKSAFSERDKFILDQYVMNGGKLFWFIDKLDISLDSLRTNSKYVPFDYPLNLDDFFFRHGIRINSDLVQDLECSRIPLSIGNQPGNRQFELFKWYYYPLAMPASDHSITHNMDRIQMKFPSTIDTLRSKYKLKHTALLTSSPYARFQMTPVQLDLQMAQVPIDPNRFNKPHLPLAVLSEGVFASLYENRISESMMEGLEKMGETFHDRSEPNKMIVVADGDLIRNDFKTNSQEYWPLGFDIYEGRSFANKQFILNAIEYLIADDQLLSARNKEIKLRPLDMVRSKEERSYWQMINVGLPMLFLIAFGFFIQIIRRRKYG